MLSIPRYRGRIMELEPVEAAAEAAPAATPTASAQVPTDDEPIVATTPAESPSDAGLGGRRVHRSFWVRDRYAERTRATGDLLEIVMATGLRVPVSRAYRSAARAITQNPGLSPV